MFITTKQLIAELKKLDPSGKAIVAVKGHFGEAIPVDTFDWGMKDVYTTPDNRWRNPTRTYVKALCIHTPDPGPDPD